MAIKKYFNEEPDDGNLKEDKAPRKASKKPAKGVAKVKPQKPATKASKKK